MVRKRILSATTFNPNEEESDLVTEIKNQKLIRPVIDTENQNARNYDLCRLCNLISGAISIFAVVILIGIGLDECRICITNQSNKICSEQQFKDINWTRKFCVYGLSNRTDHLSNVFYILERLGYIRDQEATNWNLMWAHDYPFRDQYDKIRAMKPYQKINHFPGCGYLTNKVDLATSGLKYVPPAFKLPIDKDKFVKYAHENSATLFVEKDNNHRHIHIRNLTDINLEKEGTFVQKFVDNPLLVSGYKFDIGIYTTITSINPLRIYIYNGDALLRFCPVKYYPFDPEILDKYVVGDDYLPIWNVPGLDYYYNDLGFGMRDSLNSYLTAKGKSPELIWKQIEDSIRIAILSKEKLIGDITNRFVYKRIFFEMMRFDFVVDENLTVFLMEANMSPNLSHGHFAPNKLLYEQVLYNLFSLVGVGGRIDRIDEMGWVDRMQSTDKNIGVFPRECYSQECRENCSLPMCHLCRDCFSAETRDLLLEAYREHLDRGDNKRIYPPPMEKNGRLPDNLDSYSEANRLMYKWFYGAHCCN